MFIHVAPSDERLFIVYSKQLASFSSQRTSHIRELSGIVPGHTKTTSLPRPQETNWSMCCNSSCFTQFDEIHVQVKIWHMKSPLQAKTNACQKSHSNAQKQRPPSRFLLLIKTNGEYSYGGHSVYDSEQAYRRRLAIGLESGEVLIYSSAISTPTEWREDVRIPA